MPFDNHSKKLEEITIRFGDLKDAMSLRDTLDTERMRQIAFEKIVFKSIVLIIDILLFGLTQLANPRK